MEQACGQAGQCCKWLAKRVINSTVFSLYLTNTIIIFCILIVFFSGDGIVLWKQGERVISAGSIQVRKDYRLTLVEANSLRITDVDVTDTGIIHSKLYYKYFDTFVVFVRTVESFQQCFFPSSLASFVRYR